MEILENRYKEPKVYAGWSADENIRFTSTSGGAFSELAKTIIDAGGYVVGAQYNHENLVEHSIVNDYDGIIKLRQSKYISSLPKDIFRETRKKLLEGKMVGFCGSPCQIAGLYAFLGCDYENLLTIDFICRGMNSPKAYRSWLSEIEKQENGKVARVWFKYKEGGWKSSPRRIRIDFSDGRHIVKDGENNLFMQGYLDSNLYIRPCCGKCRFKGIPRFSDITLADFWGIDKKYDDDKGTSLMLINSCRGEYWFDKVKDNMIIFEQDSHSFLENNPMFYKSAIVPAVSSSFLKDLDNFSFSDCLQKYAPRPRKTLLKRILGRIKRIAGSISKS